jgi:hypothetical protein
MRADVKAYELLNDIIFKYKNDVVAFKILENAPALASSKDQFGVTLLEKAIDKFIFNLKMNLDNFYEVRMITHLSSINRDSKLKRNLSYKLSQTYKTLSNDSELKFASQKINSDFKMLYDLNRDYVADPIFRKMINNMGKSKVFEKTEVNLSSQGYKDKTNIKVFTIDGDKNCFKEDAMSIIKEGELTKFTIYISDVDSLLNEDIFTDEMLYNNLFLRENITSIFNNQLEENKKATILKRYASFEKKATIKAIAFHFYFDDKLKLVNRDYEKVIIKPTQNYDLEDVKNIDKNKNSIMHNEIIALKKIFELHLQNRVSKAKSIKNRFNPNEVNALKKLFQNKTSEEMAVMSQLIKVGIFDKGNVDYLFKKNVISKEQYEELRRYVRSNHIHNYDLVKEMADSFIKIQSGVLNNPGELIMTNSSDFINSEIASIMEEKDLPYIYRVDDHKQRKEMLDRIDDTFIKDDQYLFEIKDAIKSLKGSPSAGYSTHNIGKLYETHDAYGCITNPGRDYDALINLHLFKKLIIENKAMDLETLRKYSHTMTYIADFLNQNKKSKKK